MGSPKRRPEGLDPTSSFLAQRRQARLAAVREELEARRAELARRKRAELAARQKEAARRRLLRFVEWTHENYEAGWFHAELCRKLEDFFRAVLRGESPRLLISAPPRHGKTAIVSQRFPVFAMAQRAGLEVACCSYAQELANDNSRVAREAARSDEVFELFPHARPQKQKKSWYGDYRRTDVDKIDLWKLGNKSSYKAVGVGGPLTGRGAHILIIDDPFKDAAEARSATRREAVWDWYTSTARTRVAPGGGIIVMCTRWDTDDLIGRLIQQGRSNPEADQWEVLNYPAIALEDDAHRRKGEALHPERWPVHELLKLKASLGPYWWAALFEGNPVPDGGNKINTDWIGRYGANPWTLAAQADEVWLTSDAAKKKGAKTDLHSIQVWARTGSRYSLLDRVAGRWNYPEYEAHMDAMRLKWRHVLTGSLIEDTANGATYLQIKRGEGEGGLHDFLPSRDTPGAGKSKEDRFRYVERAASGRQIEIPEADHEVAGLGPAAQEWLVFIAAFPAEPDDDADATSQLIMRWELEARTAQEGSSMSDIMGAFY